MQNIWLWALVAWCSGGSCADMVTARKISSEVDLLGEILGLSEHERGEIQARADAQRAIELWRVFHGKADPDSVTVLDGAPARWPLEWVCVGHPEVVYYNSDKWYQDGRRTNYYHLHNPKIRLWHPVGSVELEMLPANQRASDQQFPIAGPFPEALTVLGDCLGWMLVAADGSESLFAEPEPGEVLCAVPGEPALVSIHPEAGVCAVLGGPGLRVERRGIVG